MLYPTYASLERIQPFTLDLNWNGSKRVHFGKRSQTGTDSGSVPVRIQQVQCKRKAYLYPYWNGSKRIRSSVNGVLGGVGTPILVEGEKVAFTPEALTNHIYNRRKTAEEGPK